MSRGRYNKPNDIYEGVPPFVYGIISIGVIICIMKVASTL